MSWKNREALDARIRKLLNSGNVYFEPPENFKMKYPCVRYTRRSGVTKHAGNRPYMFYQGYDVTIMDLDPDSGLPEFFGNNLEGSRFDRHWTVDNIHHDNFVVY